MADEPKKLSPMMAKKLAQQQAAKDAAPASEANPATAPTEMPKAEATAPEAKPAQKPATVPIAKSVTPAPKADSAPKNPDGTRYGYSDGMPSVFGTPPAIDEAYFVLKTVSSIPAAIVEGVMNFFKKVTS
ncbi:MAG: hypothetical protein CMR00_08815 [[Chlorobium] sp. 445]|nr:MAG: hypothetical protein CMR00_08815 [[Chlorobium] sp. 445]